MYTILKKAGGDLVPTHLVLDLGGLPQGECLLTPEALGSHLTNFRMIAKGGRGVYVFTTFPSLGDHYEVLKSKGYTVTTLIWHDPCLSNAKLTPMTGATHPILVGVAGVTEPATVWTMMSEAPGGAPTPVREKV